MLFDQIKKNKQNIFFSLITTIISMFILVVIIDSYFLIKNAKNWVCEICQFDAELGWKNIPNKKKTNNKITYSSNSLGFRSEDIDQSKEHILIIGDSVAYGTGVNDNETVSHYLQQEISKYQVLNLAVSGYSIDQYYLKLKKEIKLTKPKYIIPIIFPENDWTETIQNNMSGVSKPFFKIKDGKLVRSNPKLSMFQCMNYFVKSWFFSKFNHDAFKRSICSFEKHNESEGEKVISILLDKIQKLGDSVNAKTIFVISPSLYNLHLNACNKGVASIEFCIANKKEFNFLLKFANDGSKNGATNFTKHFAGRNYAINQIQNLFKNSAFSYIDHLRYLSNKKINAEKLYIRGDPFHYSPTGNKYLAQSIIGNLSTNQDG